MAKVGKKYAEAAKLVDRSKSYSIEEAVALAKQTNYAKFDASVEVSFRLNVDPRHADQQIRGAMVLPNGTGKSQKVLVITQGAKEQEAKDAGADYVGVLTGSCTREDWLADCPDMTVVDSVADIPDVLRSRGYRSGAIRPAGGVRFDAEP